MIKRQICDPLRMPQMVMVFLGLHFHIICKAGQLFLSQRIVTKIRHGMGGKLIYK